MQSSVAKRWGGIGRLVKYVGADAVDAMAAMEKRGLYPTLGTFKEAEGIMLDQLGEIVAYIEGTKSTLSGLKKIEKDVKKAKCGRRTCSIQSKSPMGWSMRVEVCWCPIGVCIRIIRSTWAKFQPIFFHSMKL